MALLDTTRIPKASQNEYLAWAKRQFLKKMYISCRRDDTPFSACSFGVDETHFFLHAIGKHAFGVDETQVCYVHLGPAWPEAAGSSSPRLSQMSVWRRRDDKVSKKRSFGVDEATLDFQRGHLA